VSYDLHRSLSVDCSVGRYYNPVTGQFLSVDPLVQQTEQPYEYVNGNPVNDTDALGLGGCVWNPLCYLGKAYDAVNNALHAAIPWLSRQVNVGVCVVFTSNNVIVGFLRTEAACPPLRANQGPTGIAMPGAVNPRNLVEMDQNFLKQIGLNPEQLKRELLPDNANLGPWSIFKDRSTGDLYMGPKGRVSPDFEYQPFYIRVTGKHYEEFIPKELEDPEGGGFDIGE